MDEGEVARGFERATDMTVDEWERQEDAASQKRRRRPGKRHGVLLFLAVVAIVLAVLLVFDHRTQPCRVQDVIVGPQSASYERCAPAGEHGGVFYGTPGN